MSAQEYRKCSCQACGRNLEFPLEMEGRLITCPSCAAETLLDTDTGELMPQEADRPAQRSGRLSAVELNAAFHGSVPPAKVSFFYRLGLSLVAVTMVLLPLIYLLLIAAAGWGVYYWAAHFTFLFKVGRHIRFQLLMLCLYLTPLVAGSVMVLFMVKPLFAGRARRAQPLALNPGAEPILFAFVTQICRLVGAPFPTRIDVDCQLNASASFRRGILSFLGNDLVLTLGMPLVAGTNLRQFAGVLAHEFGHFTQGFGMRLTYIIRSVNAWFARVIYERDALDVWLEEAADTTEWWLATIVGFARLGVWFSRLILKGLMFAGHGIGCFMLRQMEYDADHYEIHLSGSDTFEQTTQRIHVLSGSLEKSYKEMRSIWNINKNLPDDLSSFLLWQLSRVPEAQIQKLQNTIGLEPTRPFGTHPSNGDRIRNARQMACPGVFELELPASILFGHFEALSKQVTRLHYEDDLGMPMELTKLRPVDSFSG